MNPGRFIARAVLALVALAPASAQDTTVTFNEVMYHPAAGTDPEWIELHNQMSVNMDLSGWTISGGVNFTFPEGTVISAGSYLLIASDPNALQTAADVTGVLGPWTGSLNNGGETIRLRDRARRVMDELSYNDAGTWPAGADGSGFSLARRPGHLSGTQGSHWTTSRIRGGTPGIDNLGSKLGPAQELFDLAAPWLYQDTSNGLPSAWAANGYTAGAGGWASGAGVLAHEDAALPAAVGTALANPAAHPTGTYYFQKQFDFAGNPATTQLTLRALLDDGAVIYLNGQEAGRKRMAAGTVTATTAADAEVNNAALEEIPIAATALVNGTNTLSVEVHQAGRPLGVTSGTGGLTLSGLALDEVGGAIFSTNHSRQAGATAFAKDLLGDGAYAPTHTIPNLNNGTHGNPSSWIGNSANSFCGISFGATPVNLGRVAWGRDNTATYFDRTAGTYILEYTSVPNPGASTPATGNAGTGWAVIGTASYPTNALPYSQRHAFSFPPVNATGIRLIVPGNGITTGACIDELEAAPPGEPVPPPPAVFKLMTTGGTLDAATDLALTGTAFAKDAIVGYPIHAIPHLNDGFIGNNFSWIGGSANSFCGISFGSPRSIGRIAFARDNTGTYTDRTLGLYTIQYTTVASPNASTPDAAWTQIGSFTVDDTIPFPSRRHVYEFAAVNATGIRVLVPAGACIDELELYSPVAPDVVWGAALDARQLTAPPVPVPLQISEIAGTSAATWRIELQNNGTTPLDVAGFVVASSGGPVSGYTLPAQILAPGGFLVLDQATLGFRPLAGDRVFVFGPGGTSFIDAAAVKSTTRSRDSAGRMLRPSADTFGAANTFSLSTDVVINEIMYHAPPGLSTPTQPVPNNPEEWIELHNRGTSAVDLSGWALDEGIAFNFPAGTMLEAGGYLVVANNAAALAAKWPEHSARILGNFTGSLSNRGERVVLSDATGNPADEVRYLTGGSWPELPDGEGSSLELRNPRADRNHGASWAASDESNDTGWQTISYTMTSGQTFGQPPLWNEFRIGMLDAGECLIDDVSVIRVSNGQQLIQGGDFSSLATKWRMLGNHGASTIGPEPGNPANSVLHVRATGQFAWNHNHIETTWAGNTALVDGQSYTVSFRARWLKGNNQLNTRGYHSRLARATELAVASRIGTPGAQNSRFVTNTGPSLAELSHAPAIPRSSEPVTVRVKVTDSDGLGAVTLRYALNGSPAFTSVAMTAQGEWYSGQIPERGAGTIVQFYVEANDSAGAIANMPAAGINSRALYIVDDTTPSALTAHELRVVMLPADTTALLAPLNRLSDARIGGTAIYRRSEIFYDAGVRLQGTAAGRIRDGEAYPGYDISFPRDRLFRGVHDSVNIDRSGRAPTVRGQDEIYVKHLFHRAGVPCTYDDLVYLVAPSAVHTGPAILQMAGYEGSFVDSQFDGDGTVFSLDGTYEPATTTDGQPESLKNPVPLATQIQSDFTNLGADKEQYRGQLEPRAGKRRDDFRGLIGFCQTMALPNAQLGAQIGSVMDVDNWMHVAAIYSLWGIGDCYLTGGFAHNLRVHVPGGGRNVRALPWDMDFVMSHGAGSPAILAGGNLLRVLNDAPGARHAYFGHLHHLCSTSFTTAYFQPWLEHYGSVVGQDMTGTAGYIQARRASILSQLPPNTAFSITTNGGADFTVNARRVLLAGSGWINVREIRRNDTGAPLEVTWTSDTSWQAEVGLGFGANPLVLTAYDFTGATVGTDTITITSTIPAPNPRDHLRITELHYHPAAPTSAAELAASSDRDDFEFIELKNFGTEELDISGCHFSEGVQITFANNTLLAPGETILVVRHIAAFQARYGAALRVAGAYGPTYALSNGGELVTLRDATGAIIQSFTYGDGAAWPQLADGPGHSLIPVAPSVTMNRSAPASWRASIAAGGNPGASDSVAFAGSPSADLDRDGLNAFLEYALGSSDTVPNGPSLQLQVEAGGTALISFTARANADDVALTIEAASALPGFTTTSGTLLSSTQTGDLVTQTWRITVPPGGQGFFARIKAGER